jgi:hypothetical protein
METIKIKKKKSLSLKKIVDTILIIELLKQLLKTEKFLFEQFLKSGSHVSYRLAIQLRIAQIKILKKFQQYRNYMKNSIISIKEIWRRIIANKKRIFTIILLSLLTFPKRGIGDAGYWSIEITEKPRPILIGQFSGKRTRPILMSWKFWNWKQEWKQERKLKRIEKARRMVKEGTHRLAFGTKLIRMRENRKREEKLQEERDAKEVERMHAFPREIEPGPYTVARARVISKYLNSKFQRTYSISTATNTMRLMVICNEQKHAKERAVFLVDWAFRGYKIWLCQKQMVTSSAYSRSYPFPYDLHSHIVEMVRIVGKNDVMGIHNLQINKKFD